MFGWNSVYYTYDSDGQLVRADDSGAGVTTLYSYDERGNLLAKNEYAYTRETPGTLQNSVTLSYASSGWLDQLTNVNGKALTYDAMGNVLTYGDRTFTWDNVPQLKSIKGDGLDVRYTYDALGKLMATTICKAVTMTLLSGVL